MSLIVLGHGVRYQVDKETLSELKSELNLRLIPPLDFLGFELMTKYEQVYYLLLIKPKVGS